MADVVYVISGRAGEYDETRYWDVGYYNTQHAADTACAVLNDMCKQLAVVLDSAGSNHVACANLIQQCRALDPGFIFDRVGTDYVVLELPQLSALKPITLIVPD